ncbi:DUF3127 domain-containing protein [Balneola sp. MJW-20]|uniref:DUF3127 domain-containing protein n=1 Tax=Gracilimonas aurantiaca TaxID=3234185 RepID=UPI003465FFBE
MDLQITGKVTQILEEQSGESKNGPWKKRDFILEIPGKYPRKVCITQWGDQIDQSNIQEGEQLTAHIDLQSREYNGRWYTDVKAWKIEKGSPAAGGGDPRELPPSLQSYDEDGENTFKIDDINDDLPF